MCALLETIQLRCPSCEKVQIFVRLGKAGEKMKYICSYCGESVIINRDVVTSESKLKTWNKLSELYSHIREAKGKLTTACLITRYEIKDEELKRKLDNIRGNLMDVETEIAKKLGVW
jgi:hypothetical protein